MSRPFECWDVHGGDDLFKEWDLNDEVFGHWFAMGFVF
jgi:hypothetical protein